MRPSWKRTALPVLAASAFIGAATSAHAGQDVAIAAQAGPVACTEAGASVQIDVAVTSTSAAPLGIFVSTGGAFSNAGAVMEWTSHGRTKGAEGTVGVGVARAGDTPVAICAVQSGANGNDGRRACTSVTVSAPCDGVSGSGEV
jgi:hypothetical protein